jgi:hypothetical protein
MKTMRDQMTYKLGKIYKLSAVTFVRLMRINQKWIVAGNALIPLKIDDPAELRLSDNTSLVTRHAFNDDNENAMVEFLPNIMGFQTALFSGSNINDMLWYLQETKYLHVARGVNGIKLIK